MAKNPIMIPQKLAQNRLQIKKLRNDRISDEKDIIAKMIRFSNDRFSEQLVYILKMIYFKVEIETQTFSIRFRIRFKKVDERQPLLKLINKIFILIISNHLAEKDRDQINFAFKFGLYNHLFIIIKLHEKCQKTRIPVINNDR